METPTIKFELKGMEELIAKLEKVQHHMDEAIKTLTENDFEVILEMKEEKEHGKE